MKHRSELVAVQCIIVFIIFIIIVVGVAVVIVAVIVVIRVDLTQSQKTVTKDVRACDAAFGHVELSSSGFTFQFQEQGFHFTNKRCSYRSLLLLCRTG